MPLRVQTLFFDMNSYFASVAQQEEPALIGRPVGILTADAPGAACIAMSVEAKARGLRMGLRMEAARALCPEVVFRPARHDVYVAYHHAIRAAVETVLPIDTAHSVDEFSCRLTGGQEELNAALKLARQVQHVILQRVGPAMRASVGVAPNTLLAKIAAEMHKPAGINWLHPSVLPERIAHLPLTDLPGISRRMEQRLIRAGVTDITGLYALAPKQARQLWGNVTGERFIRALHGETVVAPNRRGQSFGHGQQLTAGNRSPDAARLVARRLLVKAAARLRRENILAGTLVIGIKCRKHGRQHRVLGFSHTQDSFQLLRQFQTGWQAMRISAPRAVNIMLTGFIPAGALGDLFNPRADGLTAQERLCGAIDGLNQKFGQDTVRIGLMPPQRVPYTGAKIAFGRIPEFWEFRA